jgi:hypothetical protein
MKIVPLGNCDGYSESHGGVADGYDGSRGSVPRFDRGELGSEGNALQTPSVPVEPPSDHEVVDAWPDLAKNNRSG